MRISVFGLGYVGAVASACLAESGFDVIAIDKDPIKVKCIGEGRSPIVEPGLPEMIKKNVENGKLKATLDVEEAVMNSDISLICVGTPSNADGSLKLDYVEGVCAEIGEILKKKGEYHSVVLRSTVVPGTARDIAIPALEKASGKKAGEGFGFGNNPEFLRESTAIWDYFNPPKIVIGALDEKTANSMSKIYEGIEAPEVICPVDVSEGVKYADNAWHAMKVGFANELGNILKELGVDSHKVMEIFFKDTKLNISKAYLMPGFAFGGSCLPKDVRAIRASGKGKGVNTPIFDALLEANEEQVRRAHSMIKSTGAKKVGLMGLSFKAGTDDLRESPLVTLADRLINEGYELTIYDPCVFEAANMEGANQKYIREGIPHISKCLVETGAELLAANAEVIVVGNNGEDYGTILEKTNDNQPIIDLVRLKNNPVEGRTSYTGICW
ncbi:MAG: UDP-glucose/GDP-mannose dehydrogenase family protein [Alphaproteobacteria bacterium]|nr:UDP-glucose/GDP-mannose dehydrogenase family protein [Alphaproteobacteria bacterium]